MYASLVYCFSTTAYLILAAIFAGLVHNVMNYFTTSLSALSG